MKKSSVILPLTMLLSAGYSQADQVILDDLIVDGSQCVGNDCVNGETFGFDTIRLKENNLRLHFDDTSASASFPSNDWRIIINDSANGGASHFSIQDSTAGRIPFKIQAGAPANSLFVDPQGDIGLGTSTPVVELHIKDSDTPTTRLEQDGTSGWTPQTWDVAGNETNFFVRDVTNGSQLPFKIKPGADSNSLFIGGNNDIGMSTDTPDAALHIKRTGATRADIKLDAADSGSPVQWVMQNRVGNFEISKKGSGTQDFQLVNDGWTRLYLQNKAPSGDGTVQLNLVNALSGTRWAMLNQNDKLYFSKDGTGVKEMTLDGSGNLYVRGNITSGGTTEMPDYVFEKSYKLMPIDDLAKFIEEEKHLPNVPSAKEIKANGGVNMSQMQMRLLEKVEELTLYSIEQKKTIDALKTRLENLEKADQ